MQLGQAIVQIRKERGLTQEAFAKMYSVTRQTVSNWENEKSYPDLSTLVKISDEFNVSLDVLLKGDFRMVKDIDKKIKKQPFYIGIIIGLVIIVVALFSFATVYKGNIIKNLIMDCQSYTKYRPNETTGGIFVSWRRKEELPTGA